MADAMVTARMPRGKKEAGNRVFERLGTNASQVINELYDYVVAHEALPFGKPKLGQRRYTEEEISAAREWIDSIPHADVDNKFLAMSKDEVRRSRLIDRGLATEEDFA